MSLNRPTEQVEIVWGAELLGVTGWRQGCCDHATGPLSQSAGAEHLPQKRTRRQNVLSFGDDLSMPDGLSPCVHVDA